MAAKPYYQQNGITLFHGDSREILPELESETFDFVLTDPPYLVSYSGRWGSEIEPIEGDSDPSWIHPIYGNIFRLLRPDSLCLTFFGWPHAETFLSTWRLVGFRPVSVFVLAKNRMGLGYFTRAQHEQAYLLAKGKPPKPIEAPSDFLNWETCANHFHPNQKPVGALTKLLASFTNCNAIILDPFCGSGTSLLAARNCATRAVGIEIEERYCELAAIRLSQQVLDFPNRAFSLTQQGDLL